MCPQPLRATASTRPQARTRARTPATRPRPRPCPTARRRRAGRGSGRWCATPRLHLGYTSATPRLCLAISLGYLSPHLDGVRGTGSRPPEWHLETPHPSRIRSPRTHAVLSEYTAQDGRSRPPCDHTTLSESLGLPRRLLPERAALDGAAELNAERRNSAYATTYAHRRSNRRAQNLDKTERAPAAAGPEALHRVKGMSGRRSRAERCD